MPLKHKEWSGPEGHGKLKQSRIKESDHVGIYSHGDSSGFEVIEMDREISIGIEKKLKMLAQFHRESVVWLCQRQT